MAPCASSPIHKGKLASIASSIAALVVAGCGGAPAADGGPARPSPPGCGAGSPFSADGRSYCLFKEPVNFDRAQQTCAGLGAHIVFIETKSEADALLAALSSDVSTPDMWIGLREGAQEGAWAWSSGAKPQFGAWASGEPNDARGKEDCGGLLGATGKWNDFDCATEKPYLCERKSKETFSCTGRRIETQQGVYCLYDTGRKTWEQAKEACAATGATLAEIETLVENDTLRRALDANGGIDRAWIGATDLLEEGSFVWNNGIAVPAGSFGDGEPNDQHGEDCVEWYRPWNGKWNDIGCANTRATICEFEP